MITKEIGTPKSNDSQILKMKSDHVGEFYQKSIIWENDKFTAQIIQVWSKEAEFVDFNTNIHFK